VWLQLQREGENVSRCTLERLLKGELMKMAAEWIASAFDEAAGNALFRGKTSSHAIRRHLNLSQAESKSKSGFMLTRLHCQ
jgi:hypothetical protein